MNPITDKKRLDWLQKTSGSMVSPSVDGDWSQIDENGKSVEKFKTVREAIDAAMKAERKPRPKEKK